MYQLLEVSLSEDLRPFRACLQHYGIASKVTEKNGRQFVWLSDPGQVDIANSLYEQWQSGALSLPQTAKKSTVNIGRTIDNLLHSSLLRQCWVTITLMAITLIVVLITQMGGSLQQVSWFSFTPFIISSEMLYIQNFTATLNSGQFWRLVSPIFLHFSWLHLTFNLLWLFEFGKRIETHHRFMFILLVTLSAAISNTTQYAFSLNEGALFGGFSGVIYALLGFCWIIERLKICCYHIPPGIYGFMLLWLLICFTGALELVGFGKIANAAHLAGLLSGVGLGAVFGIYHKIFKNSQH